MSAPIQLQLKNNLAEVQRLGRAIAEYCAAQGIAAKTAHRITLALEELVTNTVSYGFRRDGVHLIDVTIEVAGVAAGEKAGGSLKIVVIDDAWPFDPRQSQQASLDGALEERQIGGLGLHLIENLSDEIDYQQVAGRNCTTLLFSI